MQGLDTAITGETGSQVGTAESVGPAAGRRRSFLHALRRNKLGIASLLLLVLIHLVVFVGPFVWRTSPTTVDPLASLAGSSAGHPLGLDDLGRDELSRMLYGGQITLIVGFVSMIFLVVFGVAVGALSGFFGGWVNAVLMRLTDAMMAIPNFFFVLVALTVLPRNPVMVAVVIGASSWMQVTRVVYGEILRWKSREFVEAAHALGASQWRILLRHVLPQTYSAIIVSATLGVAFAILTESAISYLGLGIQPPTPSWGNMLENAQNYLFTDTNLALYPGAAITLVVFAYSLLGDSLGTLLNRRER